MDRQNKKYIAIILFLVFCGLAWISLHKMPSATASEASEPSLAERIAQLEEEIALLKAQLAPQDQTLGVIAVNSQPWSAVMVDGKFVGYTPTTISVPVGKHQVTFLAHVQCYQTEVEVEPDQTTSAHYEF